MDIARSIIQDVDLNKYSEYETDPLGDSDLFDMMRVVVLSLLRPFWLSYFICPF